MRQRPIAYAGRAFRVVFAVCSDGSPAERFFCAELNEGDRAKVLTLFKYMGDQGRITNREKFKHVQGLFWEFKSFQIRMLCCFQPGKILVVTHGFRKQGDKIPPAELKRAERIMQEDRMLAGGDKEQWHN